MTNLSNTIINGDCLTILPTLPADSADFILTDPPYLVNYRSRDGRSVPNDYDDAWLMPAFKEMYRILKNDSFAVSFYGWASADKFLHAYRAAGFRVAGHLMFPKCYASSTGYVKYQHEAAHLLVKGTPWSMADTISDVIVALTQNILAISESLGETQPGSKTKSLLGNFATKIFMQQNEGESCLFASDQVGKEWRYVRTFNAGSSDEGSGHTSVGGSLQLTHIVDPIEFTRLSKPDFSNPLAEAIVYQSARTFNATKTERNPKGSNFLRVSFSRETGDRHDA